MIYEVLARVSASAKGTVSCSPSTKTANATITVSGSPSDVYIIWTAGTNYNIDAGDAEHGFTFKGPDPHASLLTTLTTAATSSYASLWAAHQADYKSLSAGFQLNLGQKPDLTKTTAALLSAYKATSPSVGNPYIEWLAFNLGRYMLASSARGTLPANLQGVWSTGSGAPWSGGK